MSKLTNKEKLQDKLKEDQKAEQLRYIRNKLWSPKSLISSLEINNSTADTKLEIHILD